MGSSLSNKIGRTSGGKIDIPNRKLGQEFGRTSTAMREQGPGMLEAWRAMRPGQHEMLGTLETQAQDALDREGELSDRDVQEITSAAREGANARGRVGDNTSIFQAAMDRYGLRRQRAQEARGQALQAIGARSQAEPIPQYMMGQAGQALGQEYQARTQGEIEQASNRTGLFSSGVGTAAAAIGGIAGMFMSDRRTKADIEKVGETENGLGLYDYRYKWDRPGTKRRGVMAQEVKRKQPGAVVNLPGGRMAVDYAALGTAE